MRKDITNKEMMEFNPALSVKRKPIRMKKVKVSANHVKISSYILRNINITLLVFYLKLFKINV